MIALVVAALAQVPSELRPALAPPDVAERWAAAFPDAPAPPACTPVLEARAMLCFRVWEQQRRRFVTTADLARWGVEVDDLRAAVRERGRKHLSGLTAQEVVDMPYAYLLATDGDGWTAASILNPEIVSQRVGGADVRFAVPRTGVVLAWRGGVGELDRVMAVAVRELYDDADDAVSPAVFVWTSNGFVTWGQANPRGG